jgi:hypothetical protein
MIILLHDFLFKVVTIAYTFTFAKYFFRKGFRAQRTMDKQQTQKTYLQRNQKNEDTKQQLKTKKKNNKNPKHKFKIQKNDKHPI